MSTYMANPDKITRNWYILDATNKPLGRVATKAAHILRGKHKPSFTPHVDCGDHVIVINCEKAVLTGKKSQQKFYRRHTGWIGGLKEIRYDKLMQTNPEKAMMYAVKGMLPKTTIGSNSLRRLRTYKGSEHMHSAQSPTSYNF